MSCSPLHATVFPLLAATSLCGPTRAQALAVTGVSPADHEVAASPAARVVLRFSTPIDPATVSAASVRVFGRTSGVVAGGLSVDASRTAVTFAPSQPYFPGETVVVDVAASVRAPAGGGLAGGFASRFQVRPAPGSGRFTLGRVLAFRLPGETWLATYGVFAGDLDRDGDPDLQVSNERTSDLRVLRNDGCGGTGAMAVVKLPGQEPSPQEGADFDGDGWMDVVTGNSGARACTVLINDGQGGYRPPLVLPANGIVHGVAVLDADADGDTDIATANENVVLIYANDGSGRFSSPQAYDAGPDEYGLRAADLNGDGRCDLVVANFSAGRITALLAGDGGFSAGGSIACGGQPHKIALGDFDGDGNVDCATANRVTSDTLGVVYGDGKGGWRSATTFPAGLRPTAVSVADLDGDGDLDAVTSNNVSADYTVFWNDGRGAFTSTTTLAGQQAGSCTTLVDLDLDGDLDVVAIDERTDEARIYLQDDPSLAGVQPGGCGARLRVDGWASQSGFGGTAPQPVSAASTLLLGVRGAAAAPYATLVGLPAEPGTPTPLGLANLRLDLPLLVVASGSTGAGGTALDALPIPPGVVFGTVAFQAVVSASLTNPEAVRW